MPNGRKVHELDVFVPLLLEIAKKEQTGFFEELECYLKEIQYDIYNKNKKRA